MSYPLYAAFLMYFLLSRIDQIIQVDIGIDALGGLAQATVFLNLDASATLDLTVNASGNATLVDTTKKATKGVSASNSTSAAATNGTAKAASSTKAEANSTSETAQTKTNAETSTKAATAAKAKATSTTTTTAGDKSKRAVTANGCVDLQGGLSVNAGAIGSFFGFFNAGTQVSLFNKKFQLFKARVVYILKVTGWLANSIYDSHRNALVVVPTALIPLRLRQRGGRSPITHLCKHGLGFHAYQAARQKQVPWSTNYFLEARA